eukprot:4407014-Prymnesium_polylepis.2
MLRWLTAVLHSFLTELKILYSLALHRVRGDTLKERLDSFYADQAEGYDSFRKRLLHGREEMISEVAERASGGILVDMGGGTGANLDMLGDEVVMSFAKIYIVDLCAPLMEMAKRRCAERGWHNVEVVEGDATTWVPDEGLGKVDVITFSYSLSMIPDWFVALEHAKALLSADGVLGVVDFYVARKHPAPGLAAHSWLQRNFWPTWFANDDVHLSADHLPFVRKAFSTLCCREKLAPVPYVGAIMPRVPYYIYIGTPAAS